MRLNIAFRSCSFKDFSELVLFLMFLVWKVEVLNEESEFFR